MAGMQDGLAGCAEPARAVVEDGEPARVHRHRAIALLLQGRLAESEAASRQALGLRPDDVDAMNDLGLAIWRQGRPAEAEAIYCQACALEPDDYRILTNLGLALSDLDRKDEAAECFRAALRVRPDCFDARMNLGIVLSDQGRFDDAVEWLFGALELRPDSADALQNVGMNLLRQGKWAEAIAYYERALERQPDFPEVHRNLAYALLCCGDFERGWPEHEWRLKCRPHPGARINRTFWNGDDFRGRTILLHAEQGYGDTLQFIRFAPMVKRRGGRVLVLCQTRLLRLIARCPGVDLAFEGSSYVPDCDVHAPLMSLPAIFGTTLATLPAEVPYLSVDSVFVEHWRSVLTDALAPTGQAVPPAARPFLIGIAWQGSPANRADHWRSFPMAQYAPLAEVPGVRLISLQIDHGLDQIPALGGRFPIVERPGRRPRDFLDTAAIMTQLDLVISPCTAVAHLAGGLGVRVWLALCSAGDWRWHVGREDSPWYPTMRVFRQTTFGHWEDVFHQMAETLRRELAAGPLPASSAA